MIILKAGPMLSCRGVRLLLTAAALSVATGAAHAEIIPKQAPPLSPSQVLQLLPKAPSGWNTKQSMAKTTFANWRMTVAVREFEAPPRPEQNNGKPAPPLRLTLTLIDTAGWPESVAPYKNFQTGQTPDGNQTTTIEGHPAIRRSAAEKHSISICIGERFILSAELKNGAEKELDQLLRIVDLAKIAQVPAGREAPIPNPVQLEMLNELSPKQSKVSQLYWTPPDPEAEAGAAP